MGRMLARSTDSELMGGSSGFPLLLALPFLLASIPGCGEGSPGSSGRGTGEPMLVEEVRASLVMAPDLMEVRAEHSDSLVRPEMVMPVEGRTHFDTGILAALRMAPPAEVRFQLEPVPGALLNFAAGLDRTAFGKQVPAGAEVRFEVEFNGEEALDLVLPTGPLVAIEERKWRHAQVSIESGGELILKTSATGVSDEVVIDAAFGLLEIATQREIPREVAREGEPNVLFITIDTLRADALSSYGYRLETSPALDALAQRGTRFEWAYSTSPWTWPSTASLLTGLTPPEHGLQDHESCYLSDSLLTIGEAFQSAGFTTAAFSANPLVVPSKNFDQGFEHFRSWEWAPTRETLSEVKDWLTTNQSNRFFCYLHLIDPHGPYEPDEEFRKLWGKPRPARMDEEKKPFAALLADWYAGRDYDSDLLQNMVRHKRSLYDGEIATIDQQIALIFEALEELGLADNTVIAVTSDHGEEFVENGMLAHGKQLYDGSVRVPLILAGPGVPTGKVIEHRAQNRFLGRTLLDLAGVEARANWREALNLLESGTPQDEPIFFSVRNGRWLDWVAGNSKVVRDIYGLDMGGRRFMWCPDPEDIDSALRVKLFDLAADPKAKRDLAPEDSRSVAEYQHAIQTWLKSSEAARPNVLGGGQVTIDQLRAIGYIGGEE